MSIYKNDTNIRVMTIYVNMKNKKWRPETTKTGA